MIGKLTSTSRSVPGQTETGGKSCVATNFASECTLSQNDKAYLQRLPTILAMFLLQTNFPAVCLSNLFVFFTGTQYLYVIECARLKYPPPPHFTYLFTVRSQVRRQCKWQSSLPFRTNIGFFCQRSGAWLNKTYRDEVVLDRFVGITNKTELQFASKKKDAFRESNRKD